MQDVFSLKAIFLKPLHYSYLIIQIAGDFEMFGEIIRGTIEVLHQHVGVAERESRLRLHGNVPQLHGNRETLAVGVDRGYVIT